MSEAKSLFAVAIRQADPSLVGEFIYYKGRNIYSEDIWGLRLETAKPLERDAAEVEAVRLGGFVKAIPDWMAYGVIYVR